jgi:hypothetical protein
MELLVRLAILDQPEYRVKLVRQAQQDQTAQRVPQVPRVLPAQLVFKEKLVLQGLRAQLVIQVRQGQLA